ncbi:hypothetical protein [Neptunicella sp. SCSIO 80796]|uniref:hypothetical protein n=1 Tax=Neptunicella plasticusilytica TaxID=3117012 RepID=UPI003A4DB884
MTSKKRTILFHRWYHGYTGGHQKVYDYLTHTLASGQFDVNLWVENKASVNPELFTNITGVSYLDDYTPSEADIIFLAGLDWKAYLPFYNPQQPIVNLIQHIRHGDPNHPLHQFLQYKAIRLCVSDAVRQAIAPFANGPCITIKMGHQVPAIKVPKVRDLYILAPKQPALGGALADWARSKGMSVLLHNKAVERDVVYSSMASSRISLPLPNKTEGFFLPGIEAMKLSDWAVVPDCVASREYSAKGANIVECEHSEQGCRTGIHQALQQLSRPYRFYYQFHGKRRVAGYQLKQERKELQYILAHLEQFW